MKKLSNNAISKIVASALVGSTLLLTSCASVVDQHGYVAQNGAVEDITVGMQKSEVKSILGSPNVITTESGLSYYYISSKQSRFAIVGAGTLERNVVAVHFNRSKRVSKVAHYGLKDGYLFDFIGKTTPSYSKDVGILGRLFGNIGSFSPGAAAQDVPGQLF